MIQIVVVIVHLRRRKLTLVNNVLGCQRTDVKSLRKTANRVKAIELKKLPGEKTDEHAVRCVLTKDIKLPFKVTSIKSPVLARIPFTIMTTKYDEGLKNCRLSATGCRTKDSTISGDLAPTEDTKTKVLGDFGKDALLILQLDAIQFFLKKMFPTAYSPSSGRNS